MSAEHSPLNAVLISVAMVLFYLLSPPFVMYAEYRLDPDGHVYNAMRLFYTPAERLADHCVPYRKVIKFLMRHGPDHWLASTSRR